MSHQDTVLVLLDMEGSNARNVRMHPFMVSLYIMKILSFYVSAECTANCLHGQCLETENRCQCNYGWTGSSCSEGRLDIPIMLCDMLLCIICL